MLREFEDPQIWKKQNHIDFDIFLFKAERTGLLRFLSHLEKAYSFERLFRRSSLPMWFSKGFHPRPKIDFSRALPTGIASKAEYFTVRFNRDEIDDPQKAVRVLNEVCPEGIRIKNAWKAFDAFSISKYSKVWKFLLIIKDIKITNERFESLFKSFPEIIGYRRNAFFMIEYLTEENKWHDYREILMILFGEEYPQVYYLPILKEIYYSKEKSIPVSSLL